MNLSKIKIGVYVCHCGTNIAATVDVGARQSQDCCGGDFV